MWKLEFLSSTVSVNLSVVALAIVPKVEFIFEIKLYIIIFLYESAAALNLWSIIKTHLKAHPRSSCFRGDTRKWKFFTSKVWGLSTPWSSTLRQPKHWFVFSLEVPIIEVVYLARNVPWLRKGRNPKLVIQQFDVIDEEMKKNNELSSIELQRILLACCNITVPETCYRVLSGTCYRVLSGMHYRILNRTRSSSTEILAFLQRSISRSSNASPVRLLLSVTVAVS